MKTFKFYGIDNKEIFAYKWEIENPKGIVQIIHGMAEYALRYSEFAKFLNKNGYSVYADDHRGHGRTLAPHEHPGQMGNDSFNRMVSDEFILSTLIKEENPNKKLYILGHSMGSFILQEYLIKHSYFIDKAILSGSCGKMGFDLELGKICAFVEMNLRKTVKGSKLIDTLTFKSYSAHFEEKHKNAWLNRDKNEVDLYNNDPQCGNIFPADFYYFFYKGLKRLHKDTRIKKIFKESNILIFSGDRDPVGQMGTGVANLYKMYKEIGIKNVEMNLYKDGRHEMLNEINKKEVFNDILTFIEK